MLNAKLITLHRLALTTTLALISLPTSAQVSKPDEFNLQSSPPRTLTTPQRRIVFDSAPFSVGSVVSYWDKGYLISIVPETTSPTSTNVTLYDANGHKARESAVWFPEAETVFILSAAVTIEGNVLASGTAVKHDGTRAYFIATADGSGRVTAAIQTNPFFPRSVCVAADGTIWSFGDLGRNQDRTMVEGDILRQFDFAKGLVSSYLPRSTFGSGRGSPAVGSGERREVYLRCSGNRIVIYSGSFDQYIDFDVKSRSMERFRIDRSAVDLPLRGLALTAAGDVYGHLEDYSKPNGPQGLFSLELDRNNGTVRWRPIPRASGPKTQRGVVSGLWGADGDSLVYNIFDDPAGRMGVSWSNVARDGAH